jgi:hypothetical protein
MFLIWVRIKAEGTSLCQSKLACQGNLAICHIVLISGKVNRWLSFSLVGQSLSMGDSVFILV